MTPDDRLKIELFAANYRNAIVQDDFDAQASLLDYANTMPGSTERVLEIHAELEAEQVAQNDQATREGLTGSVKEHLRGATVMTTPSGPVTFAHVAEELLRKLPTNWTADQQAMNDRLRQSSELLPDDMGLNEFRKWMQDNFGDAPDSYAQVFCRTAVKLRIRQASTNVEYQLAARRAKPKAEEPK